MSHKIKIKRIQRSIPLQNVKNDAEVEEWKSQAIIFKGARKTSKTDASIYSGLPFDVRKILVSELIEVPQGYNESRREIKNYYDSIYARVPFDGLTLEIDLKNNKLKIGEKIAGSNDDINLPINIHDYIIYYALFENDPVVAKSEKEALSNPLVDYYIIDDVAEMKIKLKMQDLKEEAQSMYLEFKNDAKKIKKILTTLNVKSKDNDESEIASKNLLTDLIINNPESFINLLKDPNMEERYLLRRLLNFRLLIVGAAGFYYDVHANEKLADTEEEMIIWLKNPENSEKIAMYKSSLQQKAK